MVWKESLLWSFESFGFESFGCRTFVHVPKDERGKLDAMTKKCIYLGLPRNEIGFRLWDPAIKKLV